MDQLNNYADVRLVNGCIYCGGREETREHVPSKVLLQKPFPTNLPVTRACFACNNGYSKDEEYIACLIACMISCSSDPDKISNTRIAKIMRANTSLRNRIRKALKIVDGELIVTIEEGRLHNVIRKLAIGHAAFELSTLRRDEPTWIDWSFIHNLSIEQRESFDSPQLTNLFAEIGSRNMQKQYVTELTLTNSEGKREKQTFIINDWVELQENTYRYHTLHETNGILVKIVFSEFIAAQVFWEEEG